MASRAGLLARDSACSEPWLLVARGSPELWHGRCCGTGARPRRCCGTGARWVAHGPKSLLLPDSRKVSQRVSLAPSVHLCLTNAHPSLTPALSLPRSHSLALPRVAPGRRRALRNGVPDRQHQVPAGQQPGGRQLHLCQGQACGRHRRRRHGHRLHRDCAAPRRCQRGELRAAAAAAGGARAGQHLAAVPSRVQGARGERSACSARGRSPLPIGGARSLSHEAECGSVWTAHHSGCGTALERGGRQAPCPSPVCGRACDKPGLVLLALAA